MTFVWIGLARPSGREIIKVLGAGFSYPGVRRTNHVHTPIFPRPNEMYQYLGVWHN